MCKRHNSQEKEDILIEFFNIKVYASELCRVYNISPSNHAGLEEQVLTYGKMCFDLEFRLAREYVTLECQIPT